MTRRTKLLVISFLATVVVFLLVIGITFLIEHFPVIGGAILLTPMFLVIWMLLYEAFR
jgi:hypothetical protein